MPPWALDFDPSPGDFPAPPDVEGYWRIIDPEEVPVEVADRVLDVADRVAAMLDLPIGVTIVFFEPCEADHPDASSHTSSHIGAAGFLVHSRPDTIAIRPDLSPALTERVVVHESRHLWQHVRGYNETHKSADLEADAHRFDRAWMEARG